MREIFEQRSSLLQKIFKYNPRKCSNASSFSGCVRRNKSKCCIVLPTDAEYVRAFEKTLIGGFTCGNTRLPFDTDILLNDIYEEKVLFDIDIEGKKQAKRILCKILKMDENNQYGMAMTKPLPYSFIKKQDTVPSLTEFYRITDNISHQDEIGHLFTVDKNFHNINEKRYYLTKFTLQFLRKIKKLTHMKDLHFNF